jgi:hypothetical protein
MIDFIRNINGDRDCNSISKVNPALFPHIYYRVNNEWVINMERKRLKYCECGCGKLVKEYNRFILGHNIKLVKPTKESLLKRGISVSLSKYSGKSKYCAVWLDSEYKDDLRERQCCKCGITNMLSIKVYNEVLSLHHSNKDKKDCAPDNIITVCKSCHAKIHMTGRIIPKEVCNKIAKTLRNRI